jgi:hypothetical protein
MYSWYSPEKSDVLVRNTQQDHSCVSPSGRRGRQAKNTPKRGFWGALNGNLPWFIGFINFSLQTTENNHSCGSEGDEDHGEKGEEKPYSPAQHLVGGLSDAEGPKKGGRESLKESHASMVRGCVPWRGLDGWDAAAVSRDAPWEDEGATNLARIPAGGICGVLSGGRNI